MARKLDHSARISQMKASRERTDEASLNSDKRIRMRKPTFMNGEVIVRGGRHKCVIRDLNDTGAMLTGTGIHNLPDDIVEVITQSGRRQARIAWRKLDCIGVQFVS